MSDIPGAVRPRKTVAPLSGAILNDVRLLCSDSEESDDDVLLVGDMNRPAVCCAQLDDFGWVVPDCVPDILLSGRDIVVELTDLTQDIHVLPDVFPVVSAGAAAATKEAAPLVVPLIEEMSLRVMSGRDIEVGLTELTQDIHVLPDVFPVVSAGEAAVPWPLSAVDESVPQVVLRKEAAPVVVPHAEEMTLRVAMVGLIEDGSDLPIALLDPEPVLSDCCIVDVSVLVPERSPVVSARIAAVPTSLLTISEVFSSAVLAGVVVAEAAPPPPQAEVGTVTVRVSVLPDAGSELPADSDMAAVVCTAPVDEAVDNALDVVSLRVGQLWFWTDSEVVLPLIVDE